MDWTDFSHFGRGNTLSYNQEGQHKFGPGNFALSLLQNPSLNDIGRCMYNNPVTGLPLAGGCGPHPFGGGFGGGGLPIGYGPQFGPQYGLNVGGFYGNGFGNGVGLGPQWGFGRTHGALGPALDGLTVGLLS
ncbi:MAG: hypothetical protein QE263_08630 [Vampirovibrionales bacterium]|nr:hypothetical protein [Vampirovibrionales bacterium]